MENEHTALNSTYTTTTAKEKRGSTPLVVLFTFTITLLLGLAFYAGPPFHSSYGVGGSGGTTRGAITAAALYEKKNEQDPCTNADKCECASCIWYRTTRNWYSTFTTYRVCIPPSETMHCPATGPSCPYAAMIVSGDDVDCTTVLADNGHNCSKIVVHSRMNFVYYNCMDDPSSSSGVCANQNVCEYA
jgi:hypothetical protein